MENLPWKLTPNEKAIFEALMKFPSRTPEELISYIKHINKENNIHALKSLYVQVSHIRTKANIKIVNRRIIGWSIPPEEKERINNLLSETNSSDKLEKAIQEEYITV